MNPGEPAPRERSSFATLWLAAIPCALFAALTLFDPAGTRDLVKRGFEAVGSRLGSTWQIYAVVNLGVALVLAVTPFGGARIGRPGAPSMGRFRWLSILLCTLLAGGGVFWSAAEPIFHFASPPPTFEAAATPELRAARALAQSHVHWGFLAWALVGVLSAITLSAAQVLDGKKLRPRALLAPFFRGREIPETLGSVTDAICIVSVVAGTVGPIGFLALQLSNAADRQLGLSDDYGQQLLILGALVLLYTVSAASGIQRGIQILSRLNVALALVLGGVVLLLGPTASVVERSAESFLEYGRGGAAAALHREDLGWVGGWTVFFWAWFLGYAPILAIFIVRVSEGRTVRELVLGICVFAPLVTNLWFCALGGTGLGLELETPGAITGPLSEHGIAAAAISIVEQLPYSGLLVPIFVVLVFCFLATTGDSIAYSISVVISGRDTPPVSMRIGWVVGMGLLAALLIRIGSGGIDALQQFIVITAAPVTLLVLPTLITGPLAARRLLAGSVSESRGGPSSPKGEPDVNPPGSPPRPTGT